VEEIKVLEFDILPNTVQCLCGIIRQKGYHQIPMLTPMFWRWKFLLLSLDKLNAQWCIWDPSMLLAELDIFFLKVWWRTVRWCILFVWWVDLS